MKNFNNCIEIDKINSQLERAKIQKKRLIRAIYKEYELYLNLVRDLLLISVEKGFNELCSDESIKNVFNKKESLCFFEKISQLIDSKLPLITIEQLKINNIGKKVEKEINLDSLGSSLKTNEYQKGNLEYEDFLKFGDPTHFYIGESNSTNFEYYQVENHEEFASIDLDNNDHINYLSNNQIIKNTGLEKQFVSSVLELIKEVKTDNTRHFENHNISQMDMSLKHQIFKNFDLIDESLDDLLLNLSYNINLELYKANLIKKMISLDSFEFLVGKKLMIKHPHPFVINFDFNINQPSLNDENLPSIIFFNISTIELEFKNLNLSIKKNKINDLKNQFQLLIKKEKYWRQKEISLNKIT